ncbi:hypothetical protein [Leifsonia sp. Root112D2]|uniref:hypothetical protein n=1 Tax=Leifsonia sp. Root112D2 TaxID=1736426 RepID=UPI0006F3D58C|nr:hypothetical protein [Leifsonia sp. Root112D2]KQV06552.1 hypothetical protein ASC63_03750 [Leifsonia sp. Root112D2]
MPAIDFFALSVGAVPTQPQLHDFAFWAVTRALLRTHYSPRGHAPERLFRMIYERRVSRSVPEGCIVSIALTEPVAMEAGVHQSVQLDGHYIGHVAVSWGTLLISILLADPDRSTIALAHRASAQLQIWFPETFWLMGPDFEAPAHSAHVLRPSETLVAGALLGFLLDLHPADQFGTKIDLDAVVPSARQAGVPWPEATKRG